jgi:zinc transport system substrate-binding protein
MLFGKKMLFWTAVLAVLQTATVAYAGKAVSTVVSILPQKYFVERIGGDLVDVVVMTEPGANPHNYEPKPRQMAQIAKAKLYFAVGVDFEMKWLERFKSTNPDMQIIHTEDGIRKIPMKAHHHHDENEPHHHEEKAPPPREGTLPPPHDHGILDPHIWLSPPNVMIIARNIVTALVSIDPKNKDVYEANYKQFIIDLINLDAAIRSVFTNSDAKRFMVFHPAWGYFAKAYGLEQIPVEIEGKEPKPKDLQHLIEHAKEHGIKVIFVQRQFSSTSAEAVAKEIKGRVAFVDPLAENWMENIKQVAEQFEAALR